MFNVFKMQQQQETSKNMWQKADILHLINLISEYKSSDIDKVNSNELYIQVANKLFDFGLSRTYIQCKNKWKELVESYNEYNKTKQGEIPLYYSELEKVLENSSSSDGINPFGTTWTEYETSFLIKVMKVGSFVNKLKTDEPLSVYEQVSQYLQKSGSIQRTKEDIQQRWKNLKQSYIKYIKGDLLHFKYFESLDALLDWEPSSILFEEDLFKDGHDYGASDYSNPDDYEPRGGGVGKRSLNWTHKEVEGLLDVVHKYNLRQMRRDDVAAVFDETSQQLRLQGYKRSAEQCRVKFKHLKVKYFAALKKNVEDHPERYFYHFDKMREIMCEEGEGDVDGGEDGGEGQDDKYEVEYLEEDDSYDKVVLQARHTTATTRQQRKARAIWSQAETQLLLQLLKAKNVKKYCRRQTFDEIALEMAKEGYKRSSQMCMIKWKNLRNQLYSCLRNMVDGREELCPFYDEICEIVHKNGQVDISFLHDNDQDQDHDFDEDEDDTFEEDKTSLKRIRSKEDEPQEPRELKKSKSCEMKSCEIIPEPGKEQLVCNYKMDDTEHYCMSLASTFKRLNKKKQAKLKIEIQKLLYQAEFEDDF